MAACLLAGLLVLAGCSGGSDLRSGERSPVPTADLDGPTGTPTPPVATPAPPETADTDRGRAFLAGVGDSGFPVRDVSTLGSAFRVTYVTNDTGERLLRDAYVLGLAYGGTVNRTWHDEAVWNATRMDALAVRADGRALARFRMPASWPLQFFRGHLSARNFSTRLRASLERTRADGGFPERDGELAGFVGTVDGETVSVSRATTRNRTAFLTLRAPVSDRAQLRAALTDLVRAYGAAATDWETAALELAIRDRDGEFHGWYRADAAFARAVADGRATVTLDERRYLAETGRLVGNG
mgnify:CR=1 FL=1